MEYIEHPALIKEWIKKLMLLLMKINLYKYEKLPSIKNKIDRNYKTEHFPKSIVESLN